MDLLQRKTRRTLLIIESQVRTLVIIRVHQDRMKHLMTDSVPSNTDHYGNLMGHELEECEEKMQSNILELQSLLQSAECTRSLVSEHDSHPFQRTRYLNGRTMYKLFKILDHRNDEVLHNNGHSLRNLAEKSASQSSLMVSMAELARYDSRTMRIVSFIALIYLPVNLVSVSHLLLRGPLERIRQRG